MNATTSNHVTLQGDPLCTPSLAFEAAVLLHSNAAVTLTCANVSFTLVPTADGFTYSGNVHGVAVSGVYSGLVFAMAIRHGIRWARSKAILNDKAA